MESGGRRPSTRSLRRDRLDDRAVRGRQEQERGRQGEDRDQRVPPPPDECETSARAKVRLNRTRPPPGGSPSPGDPVGQEHVDPVKRGPAQEQAQLRHAERRHPCEEAGVGDLPPVPGQDVEPHAEAEHGVQQRHVFKQCRHDLNGYDLILICRASPFSLLLQIMSRSPTDGMTVAFSQSLADPDWDAFLQTTNLGQYQQSSMWARYKAADGWQPLRYLFTADAGSSGDSRSSARKPGSGASGISRRARSFPMPARNGTNWP